MNPWIMGRIPDFFRPEKDVLSPMAASAHTIRNLLTDFVAGVRTVLARPQEDPSNPTATNQVEKFKLL